jgi:hypothetical protein
MRPSVPDVHITDPQDTEQAAYRPLAGQAVLGFFFGLLAPLAMFGPTFWAIPALAGVVNWRALGRIKKSDPAIAGRKIAIWGLSLSLVFLAAAPADWLAYRWMVRQEARRFSSLWFKYLTQDEPQKAFQLTVPPQSRKPLDDNLWAFYRSGPRSREDLENYVRVPVVRKLLALGPKAQVRFYETTGQTRERGNDQVEQWYAVTYEEEGERKSFFVVVQMVRRKLSGGGAGWRILRAQDGVWPAGW